MRLLELNELVRLIPWQEMFELLSTIRAPYAGLYSNSYLTQEFHRVALNASREFSLRRTNEMSCNNIRLKTMNRGDVKARMITSSPLGFGFALGSFPPTLTLTLFCSTDCSSILNTVGPHTLIPPA